MNGSDQTCFTYDAAYANSKVLAKKIVSDKVFRDRAHQTAINSKYDGCQKELASMGNKFLTKKWDQEKEQMLMRCLLRNYENQ